MNRFAILLLFMLTGCVTAPVESLKSQDVVDIPGMNKEKIFNKSCQWFAEKFGSANEIIQYKDVKEGRIIGKIITTETKFISIFNFNGTITIDIKDNKARLTYQAHDVTITSSGVAPYKREIYGEAEAEMARNSFKPVVLSYRDYMLNMAKGKDNW